MLVFVQLVNLERGVCVFLFFGLPLIRLNSCDFKSGINQKARVLGSNFPILINSNSSLESSRLLFTVHRVTSELQKKKKKKFPIQTGLPQLDRKHKDVFSLHLGFYIFRG